MYTRVKQVFSIGVMMVSVAYGTACSYELPTTTSTGGSGGGGNGNEGDCLDGLDGDNDGLIDCADPECDPGYECVPNAIPQFGDHARIVIHPAGETEPPCPLETETPVVFGKTVSPTSCTSCKCDVDVKCGNERVNLYDDMACTGTSQELVATTDCLEIPTLTNMVAYKITVLEATGTCTASTPVKTPENPWEEVVHACRAFKTSGAGCNEGRFCVPRSATPYKPGICVQAPGNLECSGEYNQKVLVFSDAQDNRSCSACDCPTEFHCNGYAVSFDTTDNCSSGEVNSAPFACTPLANGMMSMKFSTPMPDATTKDCPGGIPTGEVMPQNAVTFCCTD